MTVLVQDSWGKTVAVVVSGEPQPTYFGRELSDLEQAEFMKLVNDKGI